MKYEFYLSHLLVFNKKGFFNQLKQGLMYYTVSLNINETPEFAK